MKKRIIVLLLAVMILLIPTFALADVIVEDDLDPYYLKVADECEPYNDYLLANGPKGYVAAYQQPGSNRAMFYTLNGQRINVEYTYNDWGLIDRSSGGWIKLSETMEDTLSEEFFKQHEAECSYPEPAATLDVSTFDVFYWEYPGSNVYDLIYDLTCLSANTSETPEEELVSVITFDCTWRDADDRLWGYSRDAFTFMNGAWVCITDQSNIGFAYQPLEIEGMVPPIEASELPDPYVEPSAWEWYALAIGVVIVVAIALIIIVNVVSRHKKKLASAEAASTEEAEASDTPAEPGAPEAAAPAEPQDGTEEVIKESTENKDK